MATDQYSSSYGPAKLDIATACFEVKTCRAMTQSILVHCCQFLLVNVAYDVYYCRCNRGTEKIIHYSRQCRGARRQSWWCWCCSCAVRRRVPNRLTRYWPADMMQQTWLTAHVGKVLAKTGHVAKICQQCLVSPTCRWHVGNISNYGRSLRGQRQVQPPRWQWGIIELVGLVVIGGHRSEQWSECLRFKFSPTISS